MKKRNKFLVIILIIFLILGIMYIFFNKEENTITAVNSGIKVFYSSNNNQEENNDQQWILSKEKTEEAMENNSAVLQGIIDQVSNSGGGTVQLPAGTYYFAPTGTYIENLENGTSEKKAYYVIECRNNVKLVGAGTNESDSNSCTILKPYGMNLDVSLTMFQYINQEQPKVYIENADFADFIVDSNETSKDPNSGYGYVAQGKGFSFSPFKDCDWNNVVVKNTDGTGFGMDLPINSTITNCVAIGCGKAATENDVGASGFGIGTGYSEDESLKISNCEAIGNRKFGFFFEHQGRFVSVVKAKTAKGFLVTDCVARGNMYNFGGEKANDVIYERCVSENSKASDSNPLGNKNTQAFYFGTNSRRIYLEDCSVEQKYSNITDTSVSYYEPVYWAANNSIIDIGESKTEFNATENCPKAEAVVMLWRTAGRPGEVLTSGEQIDTGYDDVPTNAWFADAVAWAYSEGILDGGTELNAAEDCPRAHFITMLWRYAGSPIVSTGNNYTDVPEGSFYENAVNWGISEGIIESQGTEFQPSISYTKGEILDLLYKYNIINPQKTVVYDYWQNGGTDVDKVYDLKKQDENIDLSVKAQKERYEFVGWSTNKDATQGLSSLTMQTDGIDLYAIYKRDIRITYDANGGDGIPSNQTATMYNNQESINIKLSDFVPTREGHIFKGWTDEQTGTEVKYRSGETYEFKNSATLYAVWDTNELYTLTINPNGGKWNNETSTSQLTGESGTSVQISNPVPPTGYTVTFDGNGGESEEESKTSTKEFSNWSLEGEGNLAETTYTFGNGSGTITANYKNGGIELPNATKIGYHLDGWYTTATAGELRGNAGEIYTPTQTETLYARWEANSYKIEFNPNGGSGSIPSQTMVYDTVTELYSNLFVKPGYTFLGWDTNPTATEAQYSDGANITNLTTENEVTITLYAIWKKIITVEYDANGGEGAPSTSTGTIYNNEENVNITLSNTKPTKEGNIFYGWTDEQNSTEVKYQPGGTYLFTDSIVLYAVWGTDNYKLTVNPNGGIWNNSEDVSEVTGESGTSVQISNPVSPKGYTVTFDGNGGEAEETSKTSTIEFVNWTLEGEGNLTGTTYTFGNGSGTITANYRDGSIELPGATKSGCRFIGWYTSASGGIKRGDVGDNYVPTENETLYAHWEEDEVEKSYKVTYNYLENGGFESDKEQDEKETGEKIDLSVEARKEGYEFVGWSTDKNATTGITDLIMGEENVTLYAIFKKDLKITFIDYKGTEENQTIENITIYNNEKGEIDSPKINQYSDWTPRYWATGREPNSGQTIEEEELITNIIEGQTYYARYTKEIEISFDLNEGEGSLPEIIKGNLEVNSSNINNVQKITITIPDAEISREGFDFVGWMTKKDESGVDYEVGEESSFEESTILYARWAKKSEPSIDNILPVLEIENNSDGKWTNQNIKLSITAKDDDSGIEKVTVNDEVILEDEGNVSYIVKQNGTYNIEAVDKAGNITRKTITISNIDKTSPNIYEIERLTNVKEGYTDITVKSIDDDSGINVIEYSYDNEFWNDCLDKNVQKDFDVISYTYKTGESTITIRLKGTEDVTIYFRPIDVANNIGEARSITLNFDFPGDDNDNNDDNNNSINENSINNNLVNSSNNLNISSNEIEDGRSDKNLPFVGLRNTVVIFIIILCITTVFLIKRNNDFKDVK